MNRSRKLKIFEDEIAARNAVAERYANPSFDETPMARAVANKIGTEVAVVLKKTIRLFLRVPVERTIGHRSQDAASNLCPPDLNPRL
jgi:hypothetical protein